MIWAMRSSARLVSALAAASSLLALPAPAQFAQYTAPGSLADGPSQRREALESAVAAARWRLGPIRLDPHLSISDLAYVDDGREGSEPDWSVTLSAGLRAYLPVGPRTTVAAFALPEYVYWQEREEARRGNQRFGVGAFTYFNRLAVEVTATRVEDLDYVTAASAERVATRGDALALDLELPIGRRISLVASGTLSESEHDLDRESLAFGLADLDREDRSYRAGLRWYLTPALSLTGTAGRTESDFASGADDRSNRGDSWSVGLAWNRPKLGVSLTTERSDIEPEPGSRFGGFEGSTWRGQVGWRPRERFGLSLYGQRQLAYSVLASEPFFLDQRFGAALSFGIGWRLRLELFAERGELDYTETAVATGRVDDLSAHGARLSAPLGRRFRFSVGARWVELESDLPGQGYEVTEILGSIGLGLGGGGLWY